MALRQGRDPYTKQRRAGRFFCLCGFVLGFFMLSGCQTVPVGSWEPVQSRQMHQVHTVTWPQENLEVIAQWYTGVASNSRDIANANPTILAGQLVPGDKILIPSSLLKKRAAMTKTFLQEWLEAAQQRKGTARAKQKEQPVVEGDNDDLELFGPK